MVRLCDLFPGRHACAVYPCWPKSNSSNQREGWPVLLSCVHAKVLVCLQKTLDCLYESIWQISQFLASLVEGFSLVQPNSLIAKEVICSSKYYTVIVIYCISRGGKKFNKEIKFQFYLSVTKIYKPFQIQLFSHGYFQYILLYAWVDFIHLITSKQVVKLIQFVFWQI